LVWRRVLLLIAALLFLATSGQAEEKEPIAIIELGGTGEWGLAGASSFGPSAAVEFTPPIKDWLEIEAGIVPMFSRGRTDRDTDLIFKKPFTLSDKVEFMFGAGPTLDVLARRNTNRRRIGGRLYVLADSRSKVRMVSGADL
jgi:hypothetical protein